MYSINKKISIKILALVVVWKTKMFTINTILNFFLEEIYTETIKDEEAACIKM